jgi:hypothetical protein
VTNWSKRITATAVLIGGLVAVTAVAAGATGFGGLPLGGTDVLSDNNVGGAVGDVGVNLPLSACGNSVAVAGASGPAACKNEQTAKSKGSAKVNNDVHSSSYGSYGDENNGDWGNGENGDGHNGDGHNGGGDYGDGHNGWGHKRHRSGGTDVLSKNKLGVGIGDIGVNAPVSVCGNSVAVAGVSGPAWCENEQNAKSKGTAKVNND